MNTTINSDCLSGLRQLPDGSVNCCVTSPPYFGLRNYGVDGQIGLEKTPQQYVDKLVEIFREVKRVLRDDGTLWLNLGDSYASAGGKAQPHRNSSGGFGGSDGERTQGYALAGGGFTRPDTIGGGIKPKDLIGIPWRVAFALRADGWYLRQDIIWAKPNPMPESVTDRCTKAHEYIFLLSKAPRYYFDSDAIKEAATGALPWGGRPDGKISDAAAQGAHGSGSIHKKMSREDKMKWYNGTRNRRDVWTVATKPYKEAHFATFPPDLIRPCILAGCPVGGLVLDPFMGAGTTAVVCKQEDRNSVGFELNPAYCALIEKRLAATPEGTLGGLV